MPAKEVKAKTAPNGSQVSRPVSSILDDAPTSNLTLQRGEPADCFVTGASRSLQRRVMGLNIPTVPMLAEKAKKIAVKAKQHLPLHRHA